MHEGQGALGGAQGRGRLGDGQRRAGGHCYAVGARCERIGQCDRRRLAGEAHGELQRQHGVHRGERVVHRRVRELAGIDGGEPHVQFAHVAHFPTQPRHREEAVGIERRAARQAGVGGSGEGSRVRRLHVEADGGALEREAITGGVPCGLRRADARRAQPRQVERPIDDRVVLRHRLGVARGQDRVGERSGAASQPRGGGGVGAAQGDACAPRQGGRDGLRAGHRLLGSQRTRDDYY